MVDDDVSAFDANTLHPQSAAKYTIGGAFAPQSMVWLMAGMHSELSWLAEIFGDRTAWNSFQRA